MLKKKLKLFVWTGFSPDYTDGLAFAVASDESEAKVMIEKDRGFGIYIWGNLHIYDLDTPVAYSVSGGG